MERILEKARKIKMLITDVDGVLTDGKLNFFINDKGQFDEFKCFAAVDGIGLYLLNDAGIKNSVITGRAHKVMEERCKALGIHYLYQGFLDKQGPFEDLLKKEGLTPDEVAYIGDDLVDLPLLCAVGLAVCPADACPEVKQHCHYTLKTKGGEGCARETAELILKSKGLWDGFILAIKEARWKRAAKAKTQIASFGDTH